MRSAKFTITQPRDSLLTLCVFALGTNFLLFSDKDCDFKEEFLRNALDKTFLLSFIIARLKLSSMRLANSFVAFRLNPPHIEIDRFLFRIDHAKFMAIHMLQCQICTTYAIVAKSKPLSNNSGSTFSWFPPPSLKTALIRDRRQKNI